MQIPKVSQIAMLVEVDNYSQVELYARIVLLKLPHDPHALLAIAWSNRRAGLDIHARTTMQMLVENLAQQEHDIQAIAADLCIPESQLHALQNLTDSMPVDVDAAGIKADRYLMIKAWGFGFWSDVLHVLGGLMLAEISQRQPVVHWGSNSLYHSHERENAFNAFFNPIGPGIKTLTASEMRCYPPKWNTDTLLTEDNGKTRGEWSKVSGLNLLARPEGVCVMDYYIGVLNLMPYIPSDNAMSGMDINSVYFYLIRKYLRIDQTCIDRAKQFHQQNFGTDPYLALHVRGSDKVGEFKAVDKFHDRYQELIKLQLGHLPANSKIFLMTDDTRLLKNYRDIYGDRIVTTDCLRTDSRVGVHYQAKDKVVESAREVIIDTLVASQASRFVGNGYSNPSIFVYYLGDWAEGECLLIGGNRMQHYNTHLYKTIDVI